MPSPGIRLVAIGKVVTLLRGITTANGYTTTVASVVHGARILYEEPPDKFPIVDVMGGPGGNNEYPADHGESSFEIVIRGAVRGVDLSGSEGLLADIKNRIIGDPTLTGSVILISPTREDVDGGYWEHSWCEVVCTCWYEHNLGSA